MFLEKDLMMFMVEILKHSIFNPNSTFKPEKYRKDKYSKK